MGRPTWFRVAYDRLRDAQNPVPQHLFIDAITHATVALTTTWSRVRTKPTVWGIAHRLQELGLVRTPDVGVWLVINEERWDALDAAERLGYPVAFKEDGMSYTDNEDLGGPIFDPTGFVLATCMVCGQRSWLPAGALCPSPSCPVPLADGGGVVVKDHRLPCGGPLITEEDTEVQEAFRAAYRAGGWAAVYVMLG